MAEKTPQAIIDNDKKTIVNPFGFSRDESAKQAGFDTADLARAGGFTITDAPDPKPSILNNKSDSIVSSTQGIIDDENDAKAQGGDVISDLESIRQSVTTESLDSTFKTADANQIALNKILADIQSRMKAIGDLSNQELSDISAAGKSAGLRFDPLIRKAEEAKRKGEAKALISAGEVGGFLNSQFSGVAALIPTEGGDFFGAGGELQEIESVFDDNISNLEAQKQQAIIQAEASAKQAIKTGKKDDVELALKLFDKANSLNKQATDLAFQKIDAINSLQREARLQQEFETGKAEDKLNFLLDKFGVDALEANPEELTKFLKDSGFEDVDVATFIAERRKTEEAEKNAKFPPELKTDPQGNMVEITFNDDGTVKKTDVVIRKIKTVPSNKINTEIRQSIQDDINAIRGIDPETGAGDKFVDTKKYEDLRNDIAINNPEALSFFDKTFPPKQVLNPEDETAKKFFASPADLLPEEKATLDERIQDFKDQGFSQGATLDAFKDQGFDDKDTINKIKEIFNQ